MAQKKAPTKTSKQTNKKATLASKAKLVPHHKACGPECHKTTGKFVILYIILAISTVAFAALVVYLFFFSSDLINRLERIDPSCREGNCEVVRPDIPDGDDTEADTTD